MGFKLVERNTHFFLFHLNRKENIEINKGGNFSMILIRCEQGSCSDIVLVCLTLEGCMWKRKWLATTVIKHV